MALNASKAGAELAMADAHDAYTSTLYFVFGLVRNSVETLEEPMCSFADIRRRRLASFQTWL